MPVPELERHLAQLQDAGYVAPRSPRVSRYDLTPLGRVHLKYRFTDVDDCE